MKFKSATITQASGSIGGLTGASNQGGLYMRARSIPTNPNSTFQVAVRGFFKTLANAWTNTLTSLQRTGWATYAKNTPLVDSLGDSRAINENAMYQRCNVSRLQGGLARVDTAPSVFDTGSLTAPVPTVHANTTSMTMTFTAADAWNAAGGGLLVYASRPQNQSINFFKGPFRYCGTIVGPATSPQTFVLPFAAAGTGSAMFIKVSASQVDGRLSTDTIIKSTAVT